MSETERALEFCWSSLCWVYLEICHRVDICGQSVMRKARWKQRTFWKGREMRMVSIFPSREVLQKMLTVVST